MLFLFRPVCWRRQGQRVRAFHLPMLAVREDRRPPAKASPGQGHAWFGLGRGALADGPGQNALEAGYLLSSEITRNTAGRPFWTRCPRAVRHFGPEPLETLRPGSFAGQNRASLAPNKGQRGCFKNHNFQAPESLIFKEMGHLLCNTRQKSKARLYAGFCAARRRAVTIIPLDRRSRAGSSHLPAASPSQVNGCLFGVAPRRDCPFHPPVARLRAPFGDSSLLL